MSDWSLSAAPRLTPWQAHCEKWRRGCGHELCSQATKVCLARGKVPCDLLFIAEGPGVSEDVDGRPLVGPSGQLLDDILARTVAPLTWCSQCLSAGRRSVRWQRRSGAGGRGGNDPPRECCSLSHVCDGVPIRCAFTNLVGCIPVDEAGQKAVEPREDQIEQCKQRLVEFVDLCRPCLIVCVGKQAEWWLDPGYRFHVRLNPPHDRLPRVAVHHPAAILRAPTVQRPLMVKRVEANLLKALEDLGK